MARVEKPTNALGALVDTVCEANGWSKNDVVKRMHDRGYGIKSSRLSQLRTERPLPGIQADVIHALAGALAISPVRVALASIDAMGYPAGDGATVTPAEAIARDPYLSADTKQALLAILRSAEPHQERRRPA